MNLTLHYLEPGKRYPLRQARRKVASEAEAWGWMEANQDKAFYPAQVTRGWGVILSARYPLPAYRYPSLPAKATP